MTTEPQEPTQLFEIKILDPDSHKVIHTVPHLIRAPNKFRACEFMRRDYGFPKHGSWVLRAFPVALH